MNHLLSCCTLAAIGLLYTSCTQSNTLVGGYMFKPASINRPARDTIVEGWWDHPRNIEGHHTIEVDTELQQAKYYIGSTQVGFSPISSGKAGHDTPRGAFSIISKDLNHKSSSYGSIVDAKGRVLIEDYTMGQPRPAGGIYKGADMRYGMQITRNGIWMHEGAVTKATESHGCIRLPGKMAKIFFENTPVGSTVIIK